MKNLIKDYNYNLFLNLTKTKNFFIILQKPNCTTQEWFELKKEFSKKFPNLKIKNILNKNFKKLAKTYKSSDLSNFTKIFENAFTGPVIYIYKQDDSVNTNLKLKTLRKFLTDKNFYLIGSKVENYYLDGKQTESLFMNDSKDKVLNNFIGTLLNPIYILMNLKNKDNNSNVKSL